MAATIPDWLDPSPWLEWIKRADRSVVAAALSSKSPGIRELAVLLSPAAAPELETMAQRARAITRRHFGRVVTLYAPLYLSSRCFSGCVYCGFASNRSTPRHMLTLEQVDAELDALKRRGMEEVLLLTGERNAAAGYEYVRDCVERAASRFSTVLVEVFPMSEQEYRGLAAAGCTGITLYQETYDPQTYERMHLWGPKRNYAARLEAPARALAGGLRTAGLGALLGLSDPFFDMLCLYRHASYLLRQFWRGGVALSFPRIRPEAGGFQPPFPVTERLLAQIIFAFRICLPDVPLVLSTRESPRFRDGMAGVGICKMSAGSRTTVGGYGDSASSSECQFDVNDGRDVPAFCAMLRGKGLQPVFKNWDAAYRDAI